MYSFTICSDTVALCGPLRMGYHDLLIAMHLESHATARYSAHWWFITQYIYILIFQPLGSFFLYSNFVHLFPDKWLRMSTSFRWHPQPRTWVCTGVPVTRTVSTRSSTPYQIWTPVSPSAQRSTSQRNRSIPGQSKPQTCQTLLEKWDEFSVYVLFWHWTYILIFINQDQGSRPGVQLAILPHWEAEGARAACCAWGHH